METVLDSLVVKIRADTRALDQGVAAATANLHGLQAVSARVETTATSLSETGASFASVLSDSTEVAARRMSAAFERMARSGKFSFESLQNTALSALAQIVTSYAGAGLDALFSGAGGGFLGGLFAGRAGGGSVSPGQPYMVGERGPEVFVPASSGRIVASRSGVTRESGRAVNLTINIQSSGTPEAMRQSSAQVARAVRRVLAR